MFVYLLTHSWLITFLYYYTNLCLILKSVYESCMNDIKCKKLHLKLRVKYVIIINIFIHFNLTCFNSDAVIKDL